MQQVEASLEGSGEKAVEIRRSAEGEVGSKAVLEVGWEGFWEVFWEGFGVEVEVVIDLMVVRAKALLAEQRSSTIRGRLEQIGNPWRTSVEQLNRMEAIVAPFVSFAKSVLLVFAVLFVASSVIVVSFEAILIRL